MPEFIGEEELGDEEFLRNWCHIDVFACFYSRARRSALPDAAVPGVCRHRLDPDPKSMRDRVALVFAQITPAACEAVVLSLRPI
jgi:hypothetical protein